MNRSGHKHDQSLNKNIKNNQPLKSTIRSIHQSTTNNSSTKLSRSKLLVNRKQLTTTKLKQPDNKHKANKEASENTTSTRQPSSSNIRKSNDYCVNEYFIKGDMSRYNQILNNQKKQSTKRLSQYQMQQNQNYIKRRSQISQADNYSQEYGFDLYPKIGKNNNNNNNSNNDQGQSIGEYSNNNKNNNSKFSAMMKKINFSQKRGVINNQGKLISVKKQISNKNMLLNNSKSQNSLSFSKQYLSQNQTKKQNHKSKSKSRSKLKSKSKSKKNDYLKTEIQTKEKHINQLQMKMKNKQKQKHKTQSINMQLYLMNKGYKSTQILTRHSNHNSYSNSNSNHNNLINTTNNLKNQNGNRITSTVNNIRQFDNRKKQIKMSQNNRISSDSEYSLSTTSNLDRFDNYRFDVDMEQVTQQIKQNLQLSNGIYKKNNENSFKKFFFQQRLKCIDLMGKISGELKTKRETFFLSINYFDRYITNHQASNVKGIALASIMLALKIDIPELLPKYCHSFRANPQATIKKTSSSSKLPHKKKKSQLTSSTHQLSSFLQTKDRLTLLITQPIYTSSQLYYTIQKQQDFHIGQINELEVQIMSKLKFKFYWKTYSYWIDLLTNIWDQHVLGINKTKQPNAINQNQEIIGSRVLFRRSHSNQIIKTHKQFKLLSYLNQIAQKSLKYIDVYNFNTVIIVLSIMYLLIRIHIDQRKSLQPLTIYKHYRQNLHKSCNLIFCDPIGINQVFGNFLLKLNLNMANIVDSVQFVSRFLTPEEFKIYHYYRDTFGETYQDRLSMYFYNERIWKSKDG